MKKYLKLIFYPILTLIAFVSLYLLSAYILSRITVDAEPSSNQDVTIYIITNGVHTDIVVPIKNEQKDWSKDIKYSNTILKDTLMTYLAMGWGDKGFYLETPEWADLKFRVAFNAAFGLGNTAIHATFYPTMTESETCKKIVISKEQYARLIAYIDGSFRKDDDGHVINIETNANYGDFDAFYEANGSYSMLQTCNTWANKGLKMSGQRACLWTAFDTGIFLKYQGL